jgi:hypothetical protein
LVHEEGKLDPRVHADTVVVMCSEAHYQKHLQEFIRRGLRTEHCAVMAVPGGAHCLTLADSFPRFAWAGWRWLEFLLDQTRAERVALVAHEDCRWYMDRRFGLTPKQVRERQMADLQRVRASVKERIPGKRVELYFARAEGDRATFEVVT